MMATILTLIVLGMVFQGVMAVVNSVLDTVGVNSMLGSIPVVGSNLNLIWAYLFVALTGGAGDGTVEGGGLNAINIGDMTGVEALGMDTFGGDLALAMIILAFIPIKDAAISALGKGVAR